MENKDIVKYWIESSDSDLQVTESLFENGHHVWPLFLGHLVVEKLLKAYHARKGFPEKLLVPLRVVPADSKDIRSRSDGLPEMSGNDADYQFYGSTGAHHARLPLILSLSKDGW